MATVLNIVLWLGALLLVALIFVRMRTLNSRLLDAELAHQARVEHFDDVRTERGYCTFSQRQTSAPEVYLGRCLLSEKHHPGACNVAHLPVETLHELVGSASTRIAQLEALQSELEGWKPSLGPQDLLLTKSRFGYDIMYRGVPNVKIDRQLARPVLNTLPSSLVMLLEASEDAIFQIPANHFDKQIALLREEASGARLLLYESG